MRANYGKPSLVCDFIELYRHLIDDFLVEYCSARIDRKKQGKRKFLRNRLARDLMKKPEMLFESTTEVPRIKVGKKQSIETLNNEESLLFGNYLRNESETWIPRIVYLS